ncbi:ankyrin repeat-containing domain protein [Aspergillus heterothallicus]
MRTSEMDSLKTKTPINIDDNPAPIPLHDTSTAGNLPLVKSLLDSGYLITTTAIHRWDPLIHAVAITPDYGLYENGTNIIEQPPLEPERLELIRILLNSGAEIDARNERSMTALHHASSLGLYEVVEALIEFGADVEVLDGLGMTVVIALLVRGAWGVASVIEGCVVLLVVVDRISGPEK